jgi:hypothetical protein
VADVDEALVEALAAAYDHAHDTACDRLMGKYSAEGASRAHREGIGAVLAHLADRLIPADAEEREEWNSRTPADPEPAVNIGEEHAHRRTAWWVERGCPATTVKRTVRTLVGPWVEVEG